MWYSKTTGTLTSKYIHSLTIVPKIVEIGHGQKLSFVVGWYRFFETQYTFILYGPSELTPNGMHHDPHRRFCGDCGRDLNRQTDRQTDHAGY